MVEIIEAPYRLTNLDPVIAGTNGVANRWSDIWKFQVPNGVSLILKPGHTFSLYLKDAGAEVGNATCTVKIEKRDASLSDVLQVYGPDLYLASKEFQDSDLKARLQVPVEGVIVGEREYLVISALDDGTVTVADCYFELHIARVRKALGA